MLDEILHRNICRSRAIHTEEPDYLIRLSTRQTPEIFRTGCSDSRVPANVVAGLDPGEVFVHRNVVNFVHSPGMNLLSAPEFAVGTLNNRETIVCGHYGCGGVHAVCEDMSHGLAGHWLEPIRRLSARFRDDIGRNRRTNIREERLAELNVIDGRGRIAEPPFPRRAWRRRGGIVGSRPDPRAERRSVAGSRLHNYRRRHGARQERK